MGKQRYHTFIIIISSKTDNVKSDLVKLILEGLLPLNINWDNRHWYVSSVLYHIKSNEMEIVRKSVKPLQSNNNFYPTIQGIKQTAVGCFQRL